MLNLTPISWKATIFVTGFLISLPAVAVKISGIVAKSVDGDTLWVKKASVEGLLNDDVRKPEILKIRMVGIDAAESCYVVNGPCISQGHFGTDAKHTLAELVSVGTKVVVEDKGTDKYKRTLGRIFAQKEDINLKMVQLGQAVTFVICEGEACNPSFLKKERVAEYAQACHIARESGVGIWNPSDPLLEMPFEFRMRLSGRKPERWVGNIETLEYLRPEEYKEIDVCDRILFPSAEMAEAAGFTTRKY